MRPEYFEFAKFMLLKSLPYASSAIGQYEWNPAVWMATWAGRMVLTCLRETTQFVQQEKISLKAINKINPLLTKLTVSRWLNIGLVPFLGA